MHFLILILGVTILLIQNLCFEVHWYTCTSILTTLSLYTIVWTVPDVDRLYYHSLSYIATAQYWSFIHIFSTCNSDFPKLTLLKKGITSSFCDYQIKQYWAYTNSKNFDSKIHYCHNCLHVHLIYIKLNPIKMRNEH